jgi:hypothetical protein
VYALHPKNYYGLRQEEMDVTQIDLDSLEPMHSMAVPQPQVKRGVDGAVQRVPLDLSTVITKAGTYVCELYGGAGYRVRCLFRKGSGLVSVSEPSSQGWLYRLIHEETGQPLPLTGKEGGAGSLVFRGATFLSDATTGLILVRGQIRTRSQALLISP